MVVTPVDNASIVSRHSSRPSTIQGTRPTQVFTLETFSSKDFIVKDFIESLSDSVAPSRKSIPGTAANAQLNQAFDPKPLIRTFEQALNRLKSLSEDLEGRENELSGSVRRAEVQHNTNIKAREKELERAVDSFQRLERRLDGNDEEGGNVAMRIGERLEELDRQRQQAQDAKFMLQCWIEVSERGDLSLLEDVRKVGGGEGKVRCAHIARQLLRIAQRLDPEIDHSNHATPRTSNMHFPGSNGTNGDHEKHHSFQGNKDHRPREIIEKRQNFDGMQECARALRDFSEGASVISLFVNQHQFFIDRSQLVTEELATDTETWDRLADPDTEPPGVEPGLQSLIDEVKVVVQEESFIIRRAFPYYEEVLARFLQRVFQQSIQQRLEMVLNKADSISSLAFLRSLQASKAYISSLVEDLKAHGLTEHPDPANSSTAAVLDQQLEELFVPYFTGTTYIEREKRNLGELFEGLLFKFTLYHSRRRKMNVQASTYLGVLSARSQQLISSAREAYTERLDAADLPQSQKRLMLRLAGLQDAGTQANKDAEVTDEDGQLSLPNTKRMLKWLAEGVGRGLELSSSGNDMPKEVRELLSLLITTMGDIYLDTALAAATDAAVAAENNSKAEPDFNYLTDLKSAVSVLHLMLITIRMLLLPMAASNLTIRRDLEKQTNEFTDHTEAKINGVLQKTIDAALIWVGRLLTAQRKTDFRPKDDTTLQLDLLQTATCRSVFAFLSKMHSRVAAALSGQVLETFSLELATGLRGMLLTHFKSFPVSQTGALAVSKDITKYIELLRSWKLPDSFNPSLEAMTEIANLFVIGPDALRDRLRNP
ncbi:hypothetical protein AMS68_002406 [Peltaster fructicola]|uniref:Uncharacterized protein n=1 Tax=Peltaster fructicola TaxID=286661 RepID=A0A6H0XQJ5_9PEZI|nr:hypothetical protein AMS68_002406 [Peltaster fructicola]